MLGQPRKRASSRASAARDAIPNIKCIAVGKRASKGDRVRVGGKFAPVKSRIVNRIAQRDNCLEPLSIDRTRSRGTASSRARDGSGSDDKQRFQGWWVVPPNNPRRLSYLLGTPESGGGTCWKAEPAVGNSAYRLIRDTWSTVIWRPRRDNAARENSRTTSEHACKVGLLFFSSPTIIRIISSRGIHWRGVESTLQESNFCVYKSKDTLKRHTILSASFCPSQP